MVYYPKSHITPNQYSNGAMTYKGSSTFYTGYYFSTYDNKVFTGRYPGDGDNLELTYPNSIDGIINDTALFEGLTPEDTRFLEGNDVYSVLKKVKPNQNISSPPTPYYPIPTQQDYEAGEFQRYFAKKTNENIYYETRGIVNNSFYFSIELPWQIRGNKEEVYNTNKNIVRLKEQENNVVGLGVFLNFDYLQFYK